MHFKSAIYSLQQLIIFHFCIIFTCEFLLSEKHLELKVYGTLSIHEFTVGLC
jgi:hypothetical protein